MASIFSLFDMLLDQKGSDLHLGVGEPPFARIKGDLVPMREGEVSLTEMEDLLFGVTTPEQRVAFEEEYDLDFAYSYEQKARFRVNYFYKYSGPAAVFRTIPTKISTLDQLECPEAVRKLADRRAGLALVTGPTGSGKSTTLAAMVDHINRTRKCHVLTIEDPVEFVHEPILAQITHREVGHDAPSFPVAIRSAGREDPNVILIGELRNNETMKLALQLASYGVLVFATLHTNNASATIDRMINAFPADEQPQVRGMLAESLVGIVAQQLLKRKDGSGRVAAHEILLGGSALAAMIREGKTFQISSFMQSGLSQGMQTLDAALEKLVRRDVITIEAAIEKATDKESMQKLFPSQTT